jgi:hypothetical protein
MSKLNLDFVIVDEQVNDYGYRVLMSGYRPGRFESNPVLLLMHERATRGLLGDPLEDDVVLPLGRWNNIRVDNGQLVGQPEFDDQDEMAQKVQNKVEKGYMNAASAWIVPISISDDTALMLQGQTGPTVTQWEIAEASIVDIPGCKNALAIREDGKLIRQSKENAAVFKLKLEKLLIPQTSDTMDFLKLAAKLVGLPDTATSREVEDKIAQLQNGLLAETNRAQDLQNRLAGAQTEISTLKQEKADQRIADLVDGAEVARKITRKEAEHYRKLALVDFDSTKAILDNLKPYESVEHQLKEGQNGDELAELNKLTWDQLDQQNKLALLKEKYPDLYKTKYKATFNKEPKNR